MISLGTYGGGTDTTAMYIEMVHRALPPPIAILFADTGGEKPHTYAYTKMFSDWLVQHEWPAITWVKSPNETLEQNCLRREALPALSYGFKTCSQRWKQDPQKVWANNCPEIRAEWLAGRQVVKLIGYNADEPHRARLSTEPKRWLNRYFLLDEDIGRDDCYAIIDAAGLPRPGKSACFFCPSSTKLEILQLADNYPDLLERALYLERRALRNIKRESTVNGLGRRLNWSSLFEILASDVVDVAPPPPIACECVD